jgi:PAS domain S-box-containing protein
MVTSQNMAQKLNILFELNPLATIEWGLDLRIVAWNQAATNVFGYTKEEAIGHSIVELIIPKHLHPSMNSVLQALFQQIESTHNSNDNITKTGKIISCEWCNHPLLDPQGQVTGILSIVQDVTSQKQTEEILRRQADQIRQNERRYQSLMEIKPLETYTFLESVLDNLPVAVFAKDAQDLKIILWNRAAEELFKIKAEDILGTISHDLFSPEQAAIYQQEDRKALHSGEIIDIPEDQIQNSDGDIRILHTKKTPIFNEAGILQSLLVISEDITDRKIAEQQLRDQTAILEAFVEHTPVPIALFDQEMRYLVANRCWLVDNNLGEQDIIGRSQYEVFPDLPDRWKAGHQRCLAGATESGEADPFLRADGSLDYVRWQCLPWRNAQGEIGGILMYSEIITKRVKAEEERRNLAAIVSNTSDFVGIASLEGKLLYTNPAGLELVGLDSLESSRTKEIIDLFAPQERESIFQSIDEIMTQGKWQGERIFKHFVTGEEIAAHANVFLINDPVTNQPLYMAAIIRDIRTAKAAQQQLQKKASREELLNRMMNNIRGSLDFDEILQKAVTEVRNFLDVEDCNLSKYFPAHGDVGSCWEVLQQSKVPGTHETPKTYRTLAADIISKNLLDLQTVRIDNVETCEDRRVRTILRRFGVKSIVMCPALLGDEVLVSFSCANYQHARRWLDEEVELLQAIMEQLAIALNQADLYQKAESRARELEEILRELQRTQGQLVQSEKMSSLGQLVAGVAHEINNPVNFIYGNLSHASEYSQDLIRLVALYQKYYPDPVPEIAAEAASIDLEFLLTDLPQLLASMKVGADRIKQIVHSLRNFSRMDEAAMKAVNIHEGIDSTLLILQNRLKAKANQPEILVIKEYGEIPLVECYAGELNQVFMNIITNAIDALEERDSQRTFAECQQNLSQIRIHTTLVDHLDYPDSAANDSASPQVQITISDNGSGIPQTIQQRIFDPFFTTKEIGKGTGLGMSISYQIITERHHGSLLCESPSEGGASFIIRIPLHQSQS